eukprot:1191081-Prorocentrum_minimum.AAC.2
MPGQLLPAGHAGAGRGGGGRGGGGGSGAHPRTVRLRPYGPGVCGRGGPGQAGGGLPAPRMLPEGGGRAGFERSRAAFGLGGGGEAQRARGCAPPRTDWSIMRIYPRFLRLIGPS